MKTPKTTIEGHSRVEPQGPLGPIAPFKEPHEVPQSLRTTLANLVTQGHSAEEVAGIFGVPAEWVRLFEADLKKSRK